MPRQELSHKQRPVVEARPLECAAANGDVTRPEDQGLNFGVAGINFPISRGGRPKLVQDHFWPWLVELFPLTATFP